LASFLVAYIFSFANGTQQQQAVDPAVEFVAQLFFQGRNIDSGSLAAQRCEHGRVNAGPGTRLGARWSLGCRLVNPAPVSGQATQHSQKNDEGPPHAASDHELLPSDYSQRKDPNRYKGCKEISAGKSWAFQSKAGERVKIHGIWKKITAAGAVATWALPGKSSDDVKSAED
jgi:hypothetical protein